jgi:hypothetical protein
MGTVIRRDKRIDAQTVDAFRHFGVATVLMMSSGTSATGVVLYMVPVAAISAAAVFALSFRRV